LLVIEQKSLVIDAPAFVGQADAWPAAARQSLNSRKLPSMLAPCPVSAHPPAVPAGSTSTWHARLELGFAADGARTALVHRLHQGPLRVQKALYPEGPEVCHALVLHPPAGIAGGDELTIQVKVAAGARGAWCARLASLARSAGAVRLLWLAGQ
jgi:hypothetical protein